MAKIYESFLGGGGGYTRAQRTGLRRSAEIKKRRKEEERVFEKTQEREKGRRALTERSMMEAGATRRAGMGEVGATERERMSGVSQMTRQGLVGEQETEAARVKAIREADAATMKHGREMTLAETKGPTDWKETETFAGDKFFYSPSTGKSKYPQSPGEAARSSLGEGGAPKSVLTDFLAKDDTEKRAYMDQLKKEDPDAYLALAKQYKMWSAPKREGSEGVSGADIRRSLGGAYANF